MSEGERPTVFQVGGAVREGALYVTRWADEALPAALRRGELCFVLAPRQMGKSSLKVRTAAALRTEGVACVEVDLTAIGSRDVSAEQWYFGLADEISSQLELELDLPRFWAERAALSPVHRFSRFLTDALLVHTRGPVVVFIDEIDGVLALPFSADDFFAAIRAAWNRRAELKELDRLTFCLLGVASPRDLVRDPARTPFNVGVAVPLEDFSWEEAQAFVPGLGMVSDDPGALLDAVLSWTEGHPYMTQRVSAALHPDTRGLDPERRVREVVEALFFLPGPAGDANLDTARDRVLRSGELRPGMLALYRRLLEGARVEADERDPVQMALRLSGMVACRRDGEAIVLKVRNRIFASVFDGPWVLEQEQDRPFAGALSQWLRSGRRDDDVLRGQALLEATAWAHHRSDLTPEEAAFLLQGLELSRRQELDRMERGRFEQERAHEQERRQGLIQRDRLQKRLVLAMGAVILAFMFALITFAALLQRVEEEKLAAVQATDRLREAELERQRALAEGATHQEVTQDLTTQLAQAVQDREDALTQAAQARAEAQAAAERALAREVEAKDALARERAARQFADDTLVRFEQEARAAAEARRQADEALAARRAAEDRALATERAARAELLSHLAGQGLAAVAAGVQAVTVSPRPPATAWPALAEALTTLGGPVLGAHTNVVSDAAFSPDGATVLTGSWDHTARLWDGVTGLLEVTLPGHDQTVTRVAFSPDGRTVVTTGEDGLAYLFDTSGRRLATLAGHGAVVRGAAFSPDGARVVTASFDRTARVWEVPSGLLVATLSGHREGVSAVAYAPDGTRVATASWDHTVRLWDPTTGRALEVLSGHTGAVSALAFSPDGTTLASASADRTARLWRMPGGRPLATLKGHGAGLSALVFSPDGNRLVTASDDTTAQVWEVPSGAFLATLGGHTGTVSFVDYSADGRQIVTGSHDQTARLWDARTGGSRGVLKGHTSPVLTARFSPGGQAVLTASMDRTAHLWGARGGLVSAVLWEHNDQVTDVAWGPGGQRVVTASKDSFGRIWDARTGALVSRLEGLDGRWTQVAFSPGGDRVVSAGMDGTVALWDARDGRLLTSTRPLGDQIVTGVVFSPDGRRLLAWGDATTVAVLSADGLRRMGVLAGHRGPVRVARFSPGGGTVVTASEDTTARLWDVESGREVLSFGRHTGPLLDAAFDGSGERLVTASADGTARIWDTRTGAPLAALATHRGDVTGARFVLGGRGVVTAGQDQTLVLWTAEGNLLHVLRGHTNRVTSLDVSPDGQRVLSAGPDGAVRLWDAASGDLMASWAQHYGRVAAARFSPDGERAATASLDGTALILPASGRRFLSLACGLLRPHPVWAEVESVCQP